MQTAKSASKSFAPAPSFLHLYSGLAQAVSKRVEISAVGRREVFIVSHFALKIAVHRWVRADAGNLSVTNTVKSLGVLSSALRNQERVHTFL